MTAVTFWKWKPAPNLRLATPATITHAPSCSVNNDVTRRRRQAPSPSLGAKPHMRYAMRNWQMTFMLGAGVLAVTLPMACLRETDDMAHGAAPTAVAAPHKHVHSSEALSGNETLVQPQSQSVPEPLSTAQDDLYRSYVALFSADSGERAAALDRVAARPDRNYPQETINRLLEMSADADADVAERATRALTEQIGRRVIQEARTPPTAQAREASRPAAGVDSGAGGGDRFGMLSDQPDP